MKFWAAIRTGISELLAHKLRSLLTMMGEMLADRWEASLKMGEPGIQDSELGLVGSQRD